MRYLPILLAVTASLIVARCTTPAVMTSADRAKCNAQLLAIVDRYREASMDTSVTIAASIAEGKDSATRAAIRDCGATITTETPGMVFMRAASKLVPCLSKIDGIERMEYSPMSVPSI